MELLEKLQDYLDDLDVKYFVADSLEGSDYEGYVCVYVDSNEIDVDKLVDLGFTRITNDLLYIPIDKAEKINENKIKEIKVLYYDRFSKKGKIEDYRKRLFLLKDLWQEIADKMYEINLFFSLENNVEFFSPTLETLHRGSRLPSMIATNETTFGEFCYYLYQLSCESVIEKTKDCLIKLVQERYPEVDRNKDAAFKFLKDNLLEKDDFYSDLPLLRHYYIHIKGAEKKNSKIELRKQMKHFQEKRGVKRLRNDLNYFHYQYQILKDFNSYLTKIDDVIKTKL